MMNKILNVSCTEKDVIMNWNTDHVCLLFDEDIKVVLQSYIQIIQT